MLPLLLLLVLWLPAYAQPREWLTKYEQSNFEETGRYDETVRLCKRLAAESPLVTYRSFGQSAEGRELPLLEVNSDGDAEWPLLFIIAGSHAGEIDGKDAGLTLLRDAAIFNLHPGLLDRVRIAFVPIFNVDGHERFSAYARSNQKGPKEMGWRATAQNYNLNRDWMKADAPEMKALLRAISRTNPDLLADIHVSDGADYQYVITYGLETHENALEPLRTYNRDVLLPELVARMDSAGHEFVPYITPRQWHDVRSGVTRESYEPRFSTGYGAVINRPFMLIETHSLKDYRTRVTATADFLKALIVTASGQRRPLRRAGQQADSAASELPGRKYVLDWELTDKRAKMDLKGVAYEFVDSPIGGGRVPRWGTEHVTYPVPVFAQEYPTDSTVVPYAYVIPRPWLPYVEEVLASHGLPVAYLAFGADVAVETYRFRIVKFRSTPYEGRHPVEFNSERVTETMHLPEGSAVVPLDHPRSQVAIHLFEPHGPDSFVKWGFFSQIFEQKEYMESYVADTLAARMLAESPALAAEFNARLRSDSSFAASPDARYRFFYERSPYWDTRKDLYPIGRIVTAEGLRQVTP